MYYRLNRFIEGCALAVATDDHAKTFIDTLLTSASYDAWVEITNAMFKARKANNIDLSADMNGRTGQLNMFLYFH